MPERNVNDWATTLRSAMTAVQLTIPLTSITGLPTAGTIRFRIDDEIILVLNPSTIDPVVIRGAEGTTPAAHASGTPVYQVLTAGALDTYFQNILRMRIGTYYAGTLAMLTALSAGTGQPVNNRLYATPFIVVERQQFDRATLEPTVTGTTTWRHGFYADNGSLYPGSLVSEFPVISNPIVGINEATIDVTLAPGLYWLAGGEDAAATTLTLRTLAGGAAAFPIIMSKPANSISANGSPAWMAAGVASGALPGTFPGGATRNVSFPTQLLRAGVTS